MIKDKFTKMAKHILDLSIKEDSPGVVIKHSELPFKLTVLEFVVILKQLCGQGLVGLENFTPAHATVFPEYSLIEMFEEEF